MVRAPKDHNSVRLVALTGYGRQQDRTSCFSAVIAQSSKFRDLLCNGHRMALLGITICRTRITSYKDLIFMRAFAVNPNDGHAGLVDMPEPGPLASGQVLLRVLEVGVCGTDREIADQHYGTPPPGEDRLVIGHEALAEVIEVGQGVTALSWATWLSRRSDVLVHTRAALLAGRTGKTFVTPATLPSGGIKRAARLYGRADR